MKRKEKQTITTMNQNELGKYITKQEDDIAALLRTRYTKPSKNMRLLKTVRYTIALAKTIKRQKEIAHVS